MLDGIMQIILIISTIIGGLAAIWFFWDKLIFLFTLSPKRRAKRAGLSEIEANVLTMLCEPRGDVDRSHQLAHRLRTDEINVRHAMKSLEERGLVTFIHFSPEDHYGAIMTDAGRKFMSKNSLLP